MPLLLNTARAIWSLRRDQHFVSLAFLTIAHVQHHPRGTADTPERAPAELTTG
jgi:hypothetical protein